MRAFSGFLTFGAIRLPMMAPGTASVDEVCQGLPEYRVFDDLLVRTRHVAPYMVLFTLYGQHVLDYITRSMGFRATDPYSYSNEIIRALFHRILGDRHQFAFNQLVKLEKSLLVPRLRDLVANGYTMARFLDEYVADPDSFVTFEIDACIHLDTAGDPPRRFEIKMFTCPGQSARLLARHLYPQPLKEFFVARDFMGFIAFATIHDPAGPALPPQYNPEVPEHLRTGWFLHLAIVDVRVLQTHHSATGRAERMLTAMRADHAFLARKINLNTHDCSISMITNYVKVIHMAYVIERMRRDLEESERRRDELERRREELERQREESERRREELERRREELERQREESERERKLLLKALKDAGIPSPLDKPGTS